MLVYQRVYHGISLNGRVSEKGRVIRPTCRRNPDECGNDHADFPCYTDIAGPSSYKLVYSPELTPSKLYAMSCYISTIIPSFRRYKPTLAIERGPILYHQLLSNVTFDHPKNCGTSKTMVMVLYTIIPPAPSSNILDSTWDNWMGCQLNPIEMG